MKPTTVILKSIAILGAVSIVFGFGMVQYIGMERASALVFDLVESFNRSGGGGIPGEEFLNDATMMINGKRIELSYSQTRETVPTVLTEFAQRLPADNNGKIIEIRDTGGFVAYRDDTIFTLIAASWDAPTETSLITRAWSEVELDESSRVPTEILDRLSTLMGSTTTSPEHIDALVNSQGNYRAIYQTLLTILEENPQAPQIYGLINKVTASRRTHDVPGSDLDSVPRHPDSVRTLCMEQETKSEGKMVVLNYLVPADLAELDNFYFLGMKAAGWDSNQVFEGRAATNPLGKKYMFMREQKSCMVVLSSDPASVQTKISILYLDKIL